MTSRFHLFALLLPLALTACGDGYSSDDKGVRVTEPERQTHERCYGIARAGRDDGVQMTGGERAVIGPGTSELDWQGNAWTYVPRGTCVQWGVAADKPLPGGRTGSRTPLDRDRVESAAAGD